MSAQRNRPTATPQGQKDEVHEAERNPTDSTSNSKPRFSVDVDEDEMRLLLLYRASKLNELGRERLLGFAEGLLAAGMKKRPRQSRNL